MRNFEEELREARKELERAERAVYCEVSEARDMGLSGDRIDEIRRFYQARANRAWAKLDKLEEEVRSEKAV